MRWVKIVKLLVVMLSISMLAAACGTAEPTLPESSLFVTGGEIDGEEGLDLIWITAEHTLHAGPWSAPVEVPNADPFFINDYGAGLRVIQTNSEEPIVVFTHPLEGMEDPPMLYQFFAVTDEGLKLVYKRPFAWNSPPTVGAGGAYYVESPGEACSRLGQNDNPIVTLQIVFLDTSGSSWAEESRDDTTDTFDCRDQAG